MKQILIVDAQPTFRVGLRVTLREELDLEIWEEAASPEQALEYLEHGRPDLLVTGLEFADDTGFGFLRQLGTRFSDVPALVVSLRSDHLHVRSALSEGVRGFVDRRSDTSELVKAVRRVLSGRMHVDARIRSRVLGNIARDGGDGPGSSPLGALSDRETEVFELLAQALSTAEIADILGLTPSTVQTYLAKLKDKLCCGNQKELVRAAVLWAREIR